MRRALLLLTLAAGLAAPGCKAKVEYRDNPETAANLERCQTALGERESYIRTLEGRLAELELFGNGEARVVVELKGDLPEDAIMTIHGGGAHARGGGRGDGPDERGSARDEELYSQFVAALQRSRPSITQCYQNELKRDTRLQARTVTVDIQVDYRTTGAVQSATVNPRVSESFARCMSSIARNWKLSAMPRAVSFNYKQTLTPE